MRKSSTSRAALEAGEADALVAAIQSYRDQHGDRALRRKLFDELRKLDEGDE